MKKIYLLIVLSCFVCACSHKKPPLAPTQVVNGQSIVMPPEFYVFPKAGASTQKNAVTVSAESEE